MKKNGHYFLLFILLTSLIFTSCSKYQKLLKSNDQELKLAKAYEYYNEKDYFRALQLFEQVLPYYRGTAKAEDIAIKYAYANYYIEDYLMAGYHFKNFATTFPKSEHAEKALFMSAFCKYQNSPKYSLDQTNTFQAIKGFQLFTDLYPNSDSVSVANDYIDLCWDKLQKKHYEIAVLYYKIRDYNASIVALEDFLKTYPDTKYKESVLFYSCMASYELARKSVESKKQERFQNTINACEKYLENYPESDRKKEILEIFDDSKSKYKLLLEQNQS